MTTGTGNSSGARIVDRGYQHYTGERQGPAAAVQAIALGTVKRSLGFKRPGSAKVFPFILVGVAFLPFIVVAGLRLLIGDNISRRLPADQVWTYQQYFGWLGIVVLLLAALAAAEALCPDRRQRVLSLYYASPVHPLVYLLSQALAVIGVLLLVALLPPLLLWVANVGLAADPWSYLKDHAWQAPRIIAAGILSAAVDAALGLAVAAYTDRKGYAAGALIGGTVVASIVGGIVRGAIKASWAKYGLLLSPFAVTANAARWLLSVSVDRGARGEVYVVGALVIVAVCTVAVIRAYRGLKF